MKNDKYKTITILSLFVLLVFVLILKVYWLLPFFAVVSAYTYYKRLQEIPENDRMKAAIPTMVSIGLIVLALIFYWKMA